MPEGTNDNKFISKNNEGFPAYLDFDALRTEAIDHVGKLSGKVWTDHNVHDPGITILEALVYALLDLGYRTNLPAVDIFTPNPQDTTRDNNFLTPAQILACNPLTITDFRKLLADIENVRNAWLEVAQDYRREDYCWTNPDEEQDPCCINFLNGLYHVFVELENDLSTEQENKAIQRVKDALMTHRNICEDFIDIKILCKKQLGVCADLELEPGADVEKVYFEMIEKLEQFFSPVPRFYTLQQLLDKNKTIDDIFAGRPIDTRNSHGFLDTEEFENIKLKKSIHLSDLYLVLLQVKGIKKVQRVDIRSCDGTPLKYEQGSYLLPELHVPDFDIHCSGFRFYRNGIPLSFDSSQLDKLLALNSNGKTPYKYPSPYLDLEIPKGIYRADLEQYYSIQNEFPRVYGIGEGGLSDKASPERKAKALQLKGFLLFFDQLLANYLTQLKNIRSLFALSVPEDKTQQHTYFINKLDSVPDLQQLLRFPVEEGPIEGLGSRGSILAFPIEKKKLLEWIENGEIKKIDIEKPESYLFNTIDDRKTAIQGWQNDVYREAIQTEIVVKDNDCVFFYMTGPSEEIAFISKRYYKTEDEAKNAAATVLYLASIESNYKSYYVPKSESYTFDLELNLSTYADYLQEIAEDGDKYASRRRFFLHHLLARFAEQFTDYALLSYGFLPGAELEKKNMEFEEKFLVNYDDLSSKRGKAYDYLANGWNNDNISGFEKRFKSLSGIENLKKHSLCNFEVGEYEAQFVYTLQLAGQEFFTSLKEFPTRESAQKAAQEFFAGLARTDRYSTEYIAHDQVYAVKVDDPSSGIVFLKDRFPTKEEAEKVSGQLPEMFGETVTKEDVFIASYQYSPKIKNDAGEVIRVFGDVKEDEGEIRNNALKAIGKINEAAWKPAGIITKKFGKLLADTRQKDTNIFLDINDFKVDVNNTIIGKPELYTYEVLDKNNSFKLRSVNEFENEKQSKDDAHNLLVLLLDEGNSVIQQDEATQKWLLQVKEGEKVVAVADPDYNSGPEAGKAKEDLKRIVDQLRYHLVIERDPYTWKFRYQLGYGNKRHFEFESEEKYFSEAEALTAARLYTDAVTELDLQWNGKAAMLIPAKKRKEIASAQLTSVPVTDEAAFKNVKPAVDRELEIQRTIHALRTNPAAETFDRFVEKDPLSRQGQFVYRLVNKDGQYALYTQAAVDEAAATKLKKEVIAKGVTGYFTLQLCLKGDQVIKRKDAKTKEAWYHYQLKATNLEYTAGELAGKELVLFESVRGYASEEAAAKVFAEKYLCIMKDGLDKENYGKDKKISTEEMVIHTEGNSSLQEPLVYVPKATLEQLGAYEDQSVEALVKIVWAYPVRKILYDPADPNSEWNKRFPCADKTPETNGKKECGKDAGKYYFYFALYNKDANCDDWQSVRYYLTPEEAAKDLEFFLLLLKYHGNYHIDCSCDGLYHIYVREVLAESVNRFIDKKTAWGKDGVEHFICVAQSPNTFHTFFHPQRCCNTFYVACENLLIQHPCKYDTPKKRDEAIRKIYLYYKKLDEAKPFTIDYINESYVLKTRAGVAFARVLPEQQEGNQQSCRWAEFILATKEDQNYQVDKGNNYYLTNANGENLAFPTDNTLPLDEWKKLLRAIPAYYEAMITEKAGDQRQKIKYCIDLGFKEPAKEDEQKLAQPFYCPDFDEEDDYCEGWQTPCCLPTREQALEYLLQLLTLLGDFNNYQPVFDCVCEAYGIQLHVRSNKGIRNSPCLINNQFFAGVPAENEVVAFNPNCYPTAEMVCEAVQRAKGLINSEGLHMAEHILLRPRCKPATGNNRLDCGCGLVPCSSHFSTACTFPYWKDNNDEDPCDEREPVCFVPGSDPYSFIATIALPAWPARFRKPENRAMLEMMLHREAPAHVLLRILWLAPHDFCCFERKYKAWNRWLTQDGHCYDPDAECEFIGFLFNHPFACLDECDVCKPCNGDTPVRNICDDANSLLPKAPVPKPLLELIGTIYCWPGVCTPGYEFEECDKQSTFDPVPPPQPAPPPTPTHDPVVLARVKASRERKTKTPEPIVKKEEIKGKEEPVIDIAAKRKLVNSRFTGYKKELEELIGATKGNKTIVKARRFLDNPEPSPAEFNELVKEITGADKKTTGKKKPEAKWTAAVITQITYYLLDKYAFNGRDLKELDKSKETFALMERSGIDLAQLYHDWNPATVENYEPAAKVSKIRKLLTG